MKSDYLVAAKGTGRNAAIFSGVVDICECGTEEFMGKTNPWFEGSLEDVTRLIDRRTRSGAVRILDRKVA